MLAAEKNSIASLESCSSSEHCAFRQPHCAKHFEFNPQDI